MSFGISATAWAAIAAVTGTTYAIASGVDNNRKAGNAQERALENARKQERDAQIANNKANARKPNTSAILAAAMQGGAGGMPSTMLTGAAGADITGLVEKNTLLGG